MGSAAVRSRLRVIGVKTPCDVDWDSMSGDGAIRHCGSCRKNVYNLSEMTEAEADALLASAEELCIRYYYRADGTIVSSRCGDIRHKAPSVVTAGVVATLASCAAFVGITAAVGDEPPRASIAEPGVRVAMGGLRLIKKPKRTTPADVVHEPVPPLPVASVQDRAPAPVADCGDPWGCPDPSTLAPLAPPVGLDGETTRPSGRGVLAALLGGLVALLAMVIAFGRRHHGSVERA